MKGKPHLQVLLVGPTAAGGISRAQRGIGIRSDYVFEPGSLGAAAVAGGLAGFQTAGSGMSQLISSVLPSVGLQLSF